MKKIFYVLEGLILILAVVCVVFLVFVQIIMPENANIIPTSKFSNEIKLTPISEYNSSERGTIVLKIMNKNLKYIDVLVNGEKVDDFAKGDEVNIHVLNNDVVEIDGTKYLEKAKVEVVGISKNLKLPKLNTTITTSQSIEMLGRVMTK